MPAGRPRSGRDVPEASAMADLCVWLGEEAGDAGRDGTGDGRGGSKPRKQQEQRSGVVVISASAGRPDSWRPGAFSRRPQWAAVRYLPHAASTST